MAREGKLILVCEEILNIFCDCIIDFYDLTVIEYHIATDCVILHIISYWLCMLYFCDCHADCDNKLKVLGSPI